MSWSRRTGAALTVGALLVAGFSTQAHAVLPDADVTVTMPDNGPAEDTCLDMVSTTTGIWFDLGCDRVGGYYSTEVDLANDTYVILSSYDLSGDFLPHQLYVDSSSSTALPGDATVVTFTGDPIELTWKLSATPSSFPDVPAGHQFFDYVADLAAIGVVAGYDDGTFRPTAPVTRQAFAAYLYRTGDYDDGPSMFSDVPSGHPFETEINALADANIINGYEGGVFRPMTIVSRQAAAAFMARADENFDEFIPPVTPTFSDVGTGHPFYDEIEFAVDEGWVTGYDDDTFRPSATITRQAAAAFIDRFDRGGIS